MEIKPLMEYDIESTIIRLITHDQAWHYKIIPLNLNEQSLTIAFSEGSNKKDLFSELSFVLNRDFNLVPVDSSVINQLLSKYYRRSAQDLTDEYEQIKITTDFLDKIINESNNLKSSDIHIEIYQSQCRIRYRIDGRLIERYIIDKDQYPALINKIKIRSNLDISEKRIPQDGRIFYNGLINKFDIRVSSLPTLYGEKIVLRLLNNDSEAIALDKIGLKASELELIKTSITKSQGIILISGPTGSGKTTTLYSILKELNSEAVNILTIEDPVEYTLDGISQVNLKENIGLTFSEALRTFLRQDPDIIMLGEIRDSETAMMSIRAALTGHLVLSTIHTNSAWGTISRLMDMGIPPYLIFSTLNISIAQRLVRKLCKDCKVELSADERKNSNMYFKKDEIIYKQVGCKKCHFTGYYGRTALYEMIPITEEYNQFINDDKIRTSDVYKTKNINTLSHNAIELVRLGITSFDEIQPLLLM